MLYIKKTEQLPHRYTDRSHTDIHTYMHVCMLSHLSQVQLFVTLWTIACQVPLSMGFSRKEYWNGLPCPPPGDLPDPGIKPVSLTSPALTGRFFTTRATWKDYTQAPLPMKFSREEYRSA